jgi:hypothetical protein
MKRLVLITALFSVSACGAGQLQNEQDQDLTAYAVAISKQSTKPTSSFVGQGAQQPLNLVATHANIPSCSSDIEQVRTEIVAKYAPGATEGCVKAVATTEAHQVGYEITFNQCDDQGEVVNGRLLVRLLDAAHAEFKGTSCYALSIKYDGKFQRGLDWYSGYSLAYADNALAKFDYDVTWGQLSSATSTSSAAVPSSGKTTTGSTSATSPSASQSTFGPALSRIALIDTVVQFSEQGSRLSLGGGGKFELYNIPVPRELQTWLGATMNYSADLTLVDFTIESSSSYPVAGRIAMSGQVQSSKAGRLVELGASIDYNRAKTDCEADLALKIGTVQWTDVLTLSDSCN